MTFRDTWKPEIEAGAEAIDEANLPQIRHEESGLIHYDAPVDPESARAEFVRMNEAGKKIAAAGAEQYVAAVAATEPDRAYATGGYVYANSTPLMQGGCVTPLTPELASAIGVNSVTLNLFPLGVARAVDIEKGLPAND